MKSNLDKVLKNGNFTATLIHTLGALSASKDSVSGFYTVGDVVNKFIERCHPGIGLSNEDYGFLMQRASTAFNQTHNNKRSDLRRSTTRMSRTYETNRPSKAAYGYRIGALIAQGINSDIVKESKLLTLQAEVIAKNPLETVINLMQGLSILQLTDVISEAVRLKDANYLSKMEEAHDLASRLNALSSSSN